MSRKELTVVIPYFDDFESAREMISLIEANRKEESVKFLLVDNGSQTNEISELVDKVRFNNLSVVKSNSNLGFGGGILLGISHVKTSHVGWMPGNLKVRPDDAINLWIEWAGNPQYGAVKAARRRDSKIDFLKTLAAGVLASIFYRKNLLDSGGTPTLTETEFMRRLAKIAPPDYDFELFTMYAMRESRIKVLRPAVSYKSRKYGQSHWQTSLMSEFKLLKKLLSQKERIKQLKREKS